MMQSSHRRLLTLLVLVAAITTGALAQVPQPSLAFDEYQGGRTYIVAFPDTTSNINDTKNAWLMEDRFFLFLYSAVADSVVITSGSGAVMKSFVVPGVVTSVDVSRLAATVVNVAGQPSRNTFRLEGKYPFLVTCYMATKFGAEAWSPLPVEAWGTKYYTESLPGEIVTDITVARTKATKKPAAAPSEFMVIAAYDSTSVLYTVNGEPSGEYPLTIELSAGEAFIIHSFVDTSAKAAGGYQPDFGGSIITANKPIAVVSGNTRSQVTDYNGGISKNSFKNMMVEALAPTDQHGREFVYLPTWDDYRIMGTTGENLDGKRTSEYIRVYGSTQGTTSGTYKMASNGSESQFTVPDGNFNELRIMGAAQAVRITTDKPAQVAMNSNSAVKFVNKSSRWGQITSAGYEAVSTYMVDLTPREQWVGFAPIYSEPYPTDMLHFVNVVTDAFNADNVYVGVGADPERRFVFNHGAIPGTDLVWGTMTVTPGVRYYLRGDYDAKFSGHVYGLVEGFESFKSGSTPSSPGAYYERTALSYGYPLAPMRKVLAAPDTFAFDVTPNCNGFNVKMRAVNGNPSGLRSVLLADAVNARLAMANPRNALDVVGMGSAEMDVVAQDPRKDLSATLVVRDRTGKMWEIPVSRIADRIETSPAGTLEFGKVMPDSSSTTRRLTISNPLTRPLNVTNVRMANGKRGFSIAQETTGTIEPGGSLRLDVTMNATINNTSYSDTVVVETSCSSFRLPVTAITSAPCISIGDIDFGAPLEVGAVKTVTFSVCNQGGDTLRFPGPAGGGHVLNWKDEDFSVSDEELARLRGSSLAMNGCVYIYVTFTARDTGLHTTVARVAGSTSYCSDSAVWTARVVGAPVQLGVHAMSAPVEGYSIAGNDPNPFNGATDIRFTLGEGGTTVVEIYDGLGVRVASLVNGTMEAGEHSVRWDAAGLPSGTYYCRITSGAWAGALTMVLRR